MCVWERQRESDRKRDSSIHLSQNHGNHESSSPKFFSINREKRCPAHIRNQLCEPMQVTFTSESFYNFQLHISFKEDKYLLFGEGLLGSFSNKQNLTSVDSTARTSCILLSRLTKGHQLKRKLGILTDGVIFSLSWS